jgi:hypothetical protein
MAADVGYRLALLPLMPAIAAVFDVPISIDVVADVDAPLARA